MPKVSFVLPAYKRRFLKEAIASILAQTYRDFELVVVDDCSPENLKEVVDEFHDERLTYHRNEKNLGGTDLVAAWNHAMTYATGEWCVLASDDDVHHREYLAEMVRLSEKYPQVNLVHCRNCDIDADGKVKWVGNSRAEYESGIQMLYSSSVLRVPQRMADLMFKRKAYEAMGGFPSYPLAWYSDHVFAIKLAWDGGAVCSDKALFMYRNSSETISSSGIGIGKKIEAGMSFLQDMANLVDQVEEARLDHDDRLVLPLCGDGIRKRVYGLIGEELAGLPFLEFRRTLLDSCLPKAEKRQLMKSRLVAWLNLRRYLPRWSSGPRF